MSSAVLAWTPTGARRRLCGAVLAALAWAWTATPAAQFEPIAPEDTALVLIAPSQRLGTGRFQRRTTGHQEFTEIGQWGLRFGRRAVLVLHQASPGFYFTGEGASIDELLERMVTGGGITLGASGTSANAINALRWRRFRLGA